VTSPLDVARNAAAIRNLADTLERWGLGDAHNRAEHIARRLTADGWRELEPVPAPRGPTSTRAGREAARKLFEETLKEKR
jgi:hypothetical protein